MCLFKDVLIQLRFELASSVYPLDFLFLGIKSYPDSEDRDDVPGRSESVGIHPGDALEVILSDYRNTKSPGAWNGSHCRNVKGHVHRNKVTMQRKEDKVQTLRD